jgi:hypothetical protein
MKKPASRFKSIVPLMGYLEPDQPMKLKLYAIDRGLSVSQVARDAFSAFMSPQNDPFHQGYNAGIDAAIQIVRGTEGAKMMFPSGKSFGQLVCDQLVQFKRSKATK